MNTRTLFLIGTAFVLNSPLQAQSNEPRVWTNQQGRTVKAAFVEMQGANVVLLLENGVKTLVPMSTLAKSDQTYLQAMYGKVVPSVATSPVAPMGPLIWPGVLKVDPKVMVVTEGLQDEAGRNFHYQTGSFGFIAKAPLTPAVMREVAADFELTRLAIVSMPWSWHPKPKEGELFKVYLTETNEDYIQLGGDDNSAAGSKDDYVFVKFSSMGLKKVGPRYAYDSRQKAEGLVVGMTARLILGDIRGYIYPWASLGMEKFLRTVAYHNGGYNFTNPESALKAALKNDLAAGAKLSLKSLVIQCQTPASKQQNNAVQLRYQNYMEGMLLVYYFGFLEKQGTGLHAYFRDAAQEALAWRAYRETDGKSGRPPSTGSNREEMAKQHLDKLLAGRDDAKLAADFAAGFKSIGIKFED